MTHAKFFEKVVEVVQKLIQFWFETDKVEKKILRGKIRSIVDVITRV